MSDARDKAVTAYIGLGSNQGDSLVLLRQALKDLAAIPQTVCVRYSSIYRSQPLADMPQPDYLNAVAMLETDLAPEALLDALQAIEGRHGRRRGTERWAPRTLDLDILLYGEQRIETPRLSVPHPGIAEREFVLVPLAEIAPELEIPGLGAVARLASQRPQRGLQRLETAV